MAALQLPQPQTKTEKIFVGRCDKCKVKLANNINYLSVNGFIIDENDNVREPRYRPSIKTLVLCETCLYDIYGAVKDG